jgi:hypothetical protein
LEVRPTIKATSTYVSGYESCILLRRILCNESIESIQNAMFEFIDRGWSFLPVGLGALGHVSSEWCCIAFA